MVVHTPSHVWTTHRPLPLPPAVGSSPPRRAHARAGVSVTSAHAAAAPGAGLASLRGHAGGLRPLLLVGLAPAPQCQLAWGVERSGSPRMGHMEEVGKDQYKAHCQESHAPFCGHR